MAIAKATRVQVNAASDACVRLEVALRQIRGGERTPADPGMFTTQQVDGLFAAAKTAIDAVVAAA